MDSCGFTGFKYSIQMHNPCLAIMAAIDDRPFKYMSLVSHKLKVWEGLIWASIG